MENDEKRMPLRNRVNKLRMASLQIHGCGRQRKSTITYGEVRILRLEENRQNKSNDLNTKDFKQIRRSVSVCKHMGQVINKSEDSMKHISNL